MTGRTGARMTPFLILALVPFLMAPGCFGYVRAPADTGRATRAPGFATLAAATRAQAVAYAESLQYDTTRASSDGQYLLHAVAGALQIGPFATIAPESGAGRLDKNQLKAGRVVGRIVSRGAFAPWGLDSGTTFVWVDSATNWRIVLIPATPGNPVITFPMRWHDHPSPLTVPACQVSRARFIRHEAMSQPGMCVRCACTGWCSPVQAGADSTIAFDTLMMR